MGLTATSRSGITWTKQWLLIRKIISWINLFLIPERVLIPIPWQPGGWNRWSCGNNCQESSTGKIMPVLCGIACGTTQKKKSSLPYNGRTWICWFFMSMECPTVNIFRLLPGLMIRKNIPNFWNGNSVRNYELLRIGREMSPVRWRSGAENITWILPGLAVLSTPNGFVKIL